MYYFFDPHPGGIHGCSDPLPYQTKRVIDNINGSRMTLVAALCLINDSVKGMQSISHMDEDGTSGWIELRSGGFNDFPLHSWKVIDYDEDKPVDF